MVVILLHDIVEMAGRVGFICREVIHILELHLSDGEYIAKETYCVLHVLVYLFQC